MTIDEAFTFSTWLKGAFRCHVTLRVGQGLFNNLHSVRPDLAAKVYAQDFDPFYDDDKIAEFLSWVEDHWDDPS